jgi:ribonuclease HI
VCLDGDGWTVFRSYLVTGQMEVFDAELWGIPVALQRSVTGVEALRTHGVTILGIFRDLQAAIRWTAHLDPGPGQQRTRTMNKHARAIRAHGIEVVIHWALGHSGIPGNEDTDRQTKKALEGRGYTVGAKI